MINYKQIPCQTVNLPLEIITISGSSVAWFIASSNSSANEPQNVTLIFFLKQR